MTQKEKVLRHIREYGSITPLEAMREYGIMRLGARIADIEADGIKIEHGRISVKNRFGEKVSVSRYSEVKA